MNKEQKAVSTSDDQQDNGSKRGVSGCLCVRVESVCEASSCLMSWEAGHRRKTMMVSCWGVVSTLWWPCFRTHTRTHKEVDEGQGGVQKEEDGVRTEDNKRRRRPSYFFFFSGAFTLLEWTRRTAAAAAAADGGIVLAVLATGGQVNVAVVRSGATDSTVGGTSFVSSESFFFFFRSELVSLNMIYCTFNV